MAAPKINSAQEAAKKVLEQVKLAAQQGTFAVGGLLVNNETGEIIHTEHNRVIDRLKSGQAFPLDPTNHGERQIVSWYFANRDVLKLPPPSELTVVTSLDPCAMCAGCLTTAGFNVAVIAPDDYAGVNWNNKVNFAHTPPTVQAKLKQLFGYYSIEGSENHRKTYIGGENVAFKAEKVNGLTYEQCLAEFINTVENVRQSISGSGLRPSELMDPVSLSNQSSTKQQIRQIYPDAFSIKLTTKQQGNQFYKANEDLYRILLDLKQNTPLAKNAVALIDPFGNLLMATADRYDISPIQTAFMQLIQQYSKLRFNLANEASTDAGGYQQSESFKTLTSPRYCTLVFLHNLDYDETTTLKDFGVYGSSMEGPTDEGNFIFLEPALKGTEHQIQRQIQSLPPLYWELIGLTPKLQPLDSAVIKVTNNLDQTPSARGSLRWAIQQANKRADFNVIQLSELDAITLESDLPKLRFPVKITQEAQQNIAINSNRYSAIRLGRGARSSTIENLRIFNGKDYGVKADANSLSISNTQFGIRQNDRVSRNRLGAIRLGPRVNQSSIDNWHNSLFYRSQQIQPQTSLLKPELVLGGEGATLLAIRSDKASTDLIFSFEPSDSSAATSQSTVLSPAIETAYGDQIVTRLNAGRWRPVAKLPNGDELKLTWLSTEGGSGLAEFTTSGSLQQSSRQFDAETFQIQFSLGSTGQNGSLQPGTLTLNFTGGDQSKASLGFYPVKDPLTGAIQATSGKFLYPGDTNYERTAIALAKRKEWWLSENNLQRAIDQGNAYLQGYSPIESLSLVVKHKPSDSSFSSYAIANSLQPARILQTSDSSGITTFNLELNQSQQSLGFDFKDLQISIHSV
jgi:tRNA(Arg) A34 adenosine deaminase TadA